MSTEISSKKKSMFCPCLPMPYSSVRLLRRRCRTRSDFRTHPSLVSRGGCWFFFLHRIFSGTHALRSESIDLFWISYSTCSHIASPSTTPGRWGQDHHPSPETASPWSFLLGFGRGRRRAGVVKFTIYCLLSQLCYGLNSPRSGTPRWLCDGGV